jgi:hypothetical protein
MCSDVLQTLHAMWPGLLPMLPVLLFLLLLQVVVVVPARAGTSEYPRSMQGCWHRLQPCCMMDMVCGLAV